MITEEYTELAELAGSFIHEIKNHLGTLGLNLQILAEDFEDAETQRDKRVLQRVERLQNECQRLSDVTNDFLRFARLKELEWQRLELKPIIDEIIDFFAPTALQANMKINTYLPTGLPPVQLDPELFKQALLNLLLNAQQAMPEGGEITLQASLEESGNQITLSVIDTGPGIKPEVLERIFKPFYSTQKTGTGLGLPTTRRIIEAHRGTIDVQSDLGKGTCFTIRLPIADSDKQHEE